eukprot:jgi/Botrbrau1/6494/Bobra.0034s0067.1
MWPQSYIWYSAVPGFILQLPWLDEAVFEYSATVLRAFCTLNTLQTTCMEPIWGSFRSEADLDVSSAGPGYQENVLVVSIAAISSSSTEALCGK